MPCTYLFPFSASDTEREVHSVQAAGSAPILAFADTGSDPAHPSWALRNLLALAAAGFGEKALRVLACRTRNGRRASPRAALP